MAGRAVVPAAYVRAAGLSVGRLEQAYLRAPDENAHRCYDYSAPEFGFSCRLVYDVSGLVLSYPGIAERVA
ncbi:putative glycolipid-binding domain-containing protein [Nocardia sp. X0981]